MAGCLVARNAPPQPAQHWVRSDDFGEYNGLYLYSQTPNGKLWLSHYPEESPGRTLKPEHCGYWTETNGVLRWLDLRHADPTVYIMNTNGIYVETNGSYYVPVELMLVPFKDGKPHFE